MRSFLSSMSGFGSNKKKKSASEIFKRKMQGQLQYELTPQEKYQQALDERVAKITEEIMLGKKKAFKLPGTKQDDNFGDEMDDEVAAPAPQELTKTQKEMLRLLAHKKMEQERKLQKKKEKQATEAQKAKQKAQQQQQDALEAAQIAQLANQLPATSEPAQAHEHHHFYGHDPHSH